MFIENKFTTWYYQLIDRANSRTINPNQYYEIHHIIPRCMGGSDDKTNLVRFTAREHYIAHMLLVRMTKDMSKRKMSFGLWKMISSNHVQERHMPCNRQYEIIKRNMSQAIRENNIGKTWEEQYGKERAAELRQEFKDGVRVPWNKGKKGVYSTESIERMRNKAKNRTHSAETKQKIRDSIKVKNNERVKPVTKQKRPRIRFILRNTITNEIQETTNLREWCKDQGFRDARIYSGTSEWIVVQKNNIKTGELLK